MAKWPARLVLGAVGPCLLVATIGCGSLAGPPQASSTLSVTSTVRPAPTPVIPAPPAPPVTLALPTPTRAQPTVRTTAAPKPQPLRSGCDPNYTGCVPVASDVDCAGGSGDGPAYVAGPVRVIGQDIYGLDGNNDGKACE